MTRSWFQYAALRSDVVGCRVHPATSLKCRCFTMSDSLGPSGLKPSASTTATPVKDRGTATKRCCSRRPLRASVSPWRVHRSSQRTRNPAGWFGSFPGACPRGIPSSSCIRGARRATGKSRCSRSGCSSRSDLSNGKTPSSLKPGRRALHPFELSNERPAGWPRRRVLAKDDPHRKGHVARSAFDADLDQRSAIEVRLHHVQRHMAPSQPGLEECMFGSEIGETPGERREHAEIP